jgi:4-aminobutyrate aminotransferase-like enzyme
MLDKIRQPSAVPSDISSDEERDLLALEARYCSYGDTVHYTDVPKIFECCEGSFIYDGTGTPFLDLQMWYSAVNFGYANPRLNNALKRQIDTLPQVASQYLHREKIELAALIGQDFERKFGRKGRVHFNVGGAQAVEDSLKLVRNASGGKSLMFAFEGGYHGRTLGASAITSSYRYRRRYGHFGERAQFIPFPYHFRGPKGMSKEEYGAECVRQFARLFESEYNGVCAKPLGLGEIARIRRQGRERCAYFVHIGANDDCNPIGAGGDRGRCDMRDERPAGNGVHHFRPCRFHARAEAGGEDHGMPGLRRHAIVSRAI